MMTLTIKLFGTLGSSVQNYDHGKGLFVDVPVDYRPADLLKDLGVPLTHIGLITGDNRVLQPDTRLHDGMTVSFFSLVSGG